MRHEPTEPAAGIIAMCAHGHLLNVSMLHEQFFWDECEEGCFLRYHGRGRGWSYVPADVPPDTSLVTISSF